MITDDVNQLPRHWDVRALLIACSTFLLGKMYIQWWRPWLTNLPPGPWGIPFIGAVPHILLSKASPQETFLRWSKIYGNIFSLKVGKRIFVVLNDFELIDQALHHPQLQDRPTQTIEAIQKSTGSTHGVTTANGLFWKDQRKFMHNKLRELGVNKSQFEDSIELEVANLMKELAALNGEAFHPPRLLTCAVSNIICSVAFDKCYSYSDPNFHQLLDIISVISSFPISASALGTIPALRYVPFGPHVKYIRGFQDFHNILDDIIKDHERRGTYHSGEVTCLLDAYLQEIENEDKGQGTLQIPIKLNTVYSNIGALFFAGSETIVTTLSWAFIFLLRNPQVQEKCYKDIDRVIGHDRKPKLADRPQLPYLESVIAEVQRLGDIAPVGVPHSACSDINFHGYTIPKKAMIIPNLHAVMFDDNFWKNPLSFVPERFMDEDGCFAKSPRLIAFGTGPRKCLGEQVAQMELFLFLSTLLQHFKIKLPPGATMPSLKGSTGVTFKPMPFKVCVEPRIM